MIEYSVIILLLCTAIILNRTLILVAYRFNIQTSIGFSPFYDFRSLDKILKPRTISYDVNKNYFSELRLKVKLQVTF